MYKNRNSRLGSVLLLSCFALGRKSLEMRILLTVGNGATLLAWYIKRGLVNL